MDQRPEEKFKETVEEIVDDNESAEEGDIEVDIDDS